MDVTVWVKNLTIKVSFGKDTRLSTKVCKSKEELQIVWNGVIALCKDAGYECKILK